MNLRDHLQAIYDQRGLLTPALVVDAARDETHPLHTRFDWDDTTAAERWRTQQAADLIRSVRVTYATTPNGPRDVRAFVAVRQEDSPAANYTPVHDAMGDDFTSRLVLADMQREWKVFKRRYDYLAEYAALIAAEAQQVAS